MPGAILQVSNWTLSPGMGLEYRSTLFSRLGRLNGFTLVLINTSWMVASDKDNWCLRFNSFCIRRAPRLFSSLRSKICCSCSSKPLLFGEAFGLRLLLTRPCTPSSSYRLSHFLRVGLEIPHRRQVTPKFPEAW